MATETNHPQNRASLEAEQLQLHSSFGQENPTLLSKNTISTTIDTELNRCFNRSSQELIEKYRFAYRAAIALQTAQSKIPSLANLNMTVKQVSNGLINGTDENHFQEMLGSYAIKGLQLDPTPFVVGAMAKAVELRQPEVLSRIYEYIGNIEDSNRRRALFTVAGQIAEVMAEGAPEEEKQKLQFEGKVLTIPSPLHEVNQDYAEVDTKIETLAIADGVGSSYHSEIASHIAVMTSMHELRMLEKRTPENVKKAMQNTYEKIQLITWITMYIPDEVTAKDLEKLVKMPTAKLKEIVAMASQHKPFDEERSRSATTLSIACIAEEEDGTKKLITGHIGDTRLTATLKNGETIQLTEDDGFLKEFLEQQIVMGYITPENPTTWIKKQLEIVNERIDNAITPAEIEILNSLTPQAFNPNSINTQRLELFKKRKHVQRSIQVDRNDGLTITEHANINVDDIFCIKGTSDGIHDNSTRQDSEIAMKALAQEALDRGSVTAQKVVDTETLLAKERSDKLEFEVLSKNKWRYREDIAGFQKFIRSTVLTRPQQTQIAEWIRENPESSSLITLIQDPRCKLDDMTTVALVRTSNM